MGKVPPPTSPPLSLLHAFHPPGNLAAKVSVASPEGTESFGKVLRGEPSEPAAFAELVAQGQLLDSGGPGAWAYRIVSEGRHSLGLVAAVDRGGGGSPSRLAAACGIEPAIATLRAGMSPDLLELVRASTTERPLFHFKAADGLTHTGWTIAAREAVSAELSNLVAEIDESMTGGLPGRLPDRLIGRIILPDTPAFAPRLGLFVRTLVGHAAGGP
jgi:hypothetical protein